MSRGAKKALKAGQKNVRLKKVYNKTGVKSAPKGVPTKLCVL